METAHSLRYLSSEFSHGKFSFHYTIDQQDYRITLEHNKEINLDLRCIQVVALNLGMCYLMDLAEIVLPKQIEVMVDISPEELQFWKDLFWDVAKEKCFALQIDLSTLLIDWTLSSSKNAQQSHFFSIPNQDSQKIVCLTGGKESLALVKILENDFSLLPLFLNLEKSTHRMKAYVRFQTLFGCMRTISNSCEISRRLQKEYGRILSGVDMAHLIFNAMLFSDKSDMVIIGNEYSANYPNEVYQGYMFNHQFVKTIDFARRINAYIHQFVTADFRYYSPFFGLHEYRIADILFKDDRYLDVWTSCNEATDAVNLCCKCQKCAFTYLVTAVRKEEEFLLKYFSSNLLEDLDLFRPLVDFVGEKPLDCVGEKKEVWVALYVLLQRKNTSKVVQYFAKNILPQIQDRIDKYRTEVNAIQTVPIKGDVGMEKLVLKALS